MRHAATARVGAALAPGRKRPGLDKRLARSGPDPGRVRAAGVRARVSAEVGQAGAGQHRADRHSLSHARASGDEESRGAFEPADRRATGITRQARRGHHAAQWLRGGHGLRRNGHCPVAQVAQATGVARRARLVACNIMAWGLALGCVDQDWRLGARDLGCAARHFHRRDRHAPQWQQGQHQPDDPEAAGHQQFRCRQKSLAL